MKRDFDLVETVVGKITKSFKSSSSSRRSGEEREWLLRTQDFQLWGPFSLKELLSLSKSKKLTRYDYIAKSCDDFDPITEVIELKDIVDTIPETIFDETTDKNIDREVTEVTVRSTVGIPYRAARKIFNLSTIPLNTLLWFMLMFLVLGYCFFYLSQH